MIKVHRKEGEEPVTYFVYLLAPSSLNSQIKIPISQNHVKFTYTILSSSSKKARGSH
jgi:hypothetical protein